MAPELTKAEEDRLNAIANWPPPPDYNKPPVPPPGPADIALLARLIRRLIAAMECEDDYQAEQAGQGRNDA